MQTLNKFIFLNYYKIPKNKGGNQTKMNIKGKPKQNDRGITVIALTITVILLIILTVVVIRGITGEESILKVSETATEEYNVLQYKEQIEA